jgi:cytochrome c biogenesis protein
VATFRFYRKASTESIIGSIHLPAYPTHEYGQALQWKVPGTDIELWTMLKIEENVLPQDREFDFQVPLQHQLILRYRDQRYELRPGDELELSGGILRYQKLTTWMGYKIDYDWTRPWLLAAALIGLLGLFVHFILKFNLIVRETG